MNTYEINRLSHHDTVTVEGESLADAFDKLAEQYELELSVFTDGGNVTYNACSMEYEFEATETIEELKNANQTM